MKYAIICMILMFLTTYLIRVIPIGFVRRKMENEWIQDFLFYIPYCVLAAMTFPYVFYSTSPTGTEPHISLSAVLHRSSNPAIKIVVAIVAVLVAILVELSLTYLPFFS